MARILAVSTPKIKPTRKTARPDTPFGFGLGVYSRPTFRADHTIDDERWLLDRHAERAEFAGSAGYLDAPETNGRGWMADAAEMEERAMQAEWERRFEEHLMAGDTCAMCGHETRELTGGLCDGCVLAIDADLDINPGDGGTCAACGRACDYLEPTGLCCPCDLRADDLSASGNRGW